MVYVVLLSVVKVLRKIGYRFEILSERKAETFKSKADFLLLPVGGSTEKAVVEVKSPGVFDMVENVF